MLRGASRYSGGAVASPYLAPDGAVGAPSYSFSSSPTTGIWRPAADQMSFTAAGAQVGGIGAGVLGLAQGTVIKWSTSGSDPFGATSTTLSNQGGSNTLSLINANSAQDWRVYAGNGGFVSIVKSVNESLPIAAAATTVGATSIPAGAILLSVAVRVTTVIPTAATFTVTTTVGGTTLNTAAVSTAANSTDAGTAAGASYRAAATTVTITPNLTPGAATGVVRLTYYYIQVTPPTS